MISLLTFLTSFTVGSLLALLEFSMPVVVLGTIAAGLGFMGLFGIAFRRALVKNTIGMIEAEALFLESRVHDALTFERRRARIASWWDRFSPDLSLALPIYVSLTSKCLATRQIDEAQRWIARLEEYTGQRVRRLARYFRLLAASLAGDLATVERQATEMRARLDPGQPEERGLLAQLAFLQARWAIRRHDLPAALRLTREGHELQPELDAYYALRSQIALVDGDITAAQTYAGSLASTRMGANPPGPTALFQQILPILKSHENEFGTELERLREMLAIERLRFRAQGLYPQLEVAILSRDPALLEATIRSLEAIASQHPAATMRLQIAAVHHFSWQGHEAHAHALSEQAIQSMTHPACSDEDMACGLAWMALAAASINSQQLLPRILKLGNTVPIFSHHALCQHIVTFAGLCREISQLGIAPERIERWNTLKQSPPARAIANHYDDAETRLGITVRTEPPPTSMPTSS